MEILYNSSEINKHIFEMYINAHHCLFDSWILSSGACTDNSSDLEGGCSDRATCRAHLRNDPPFHLQHAPPQTTNLYFVSNFILFFLFLLLLF